MTDQYVLPQKVPAINLHLRYSA